MATIDIDEGGFTVRLTTTEKLAGLLRDVRVPASAVRQVEVLPDGLRATRGMRFPGTELPRRRKIGTWRSRAGKALVSVSRGRPAVRVTLDGHAYREILVSVDDPDAVRAALAPERA